MTQKVVRIERCAGKQPVSKFEGDHLATMQVTGEDQVETLLFCRSPDSWIVRAEDSDVAFGRDVSVGARHNDRPRIICDIRVTVVNPVSSATLDSCSDVANPHAIVVISTDGEYLADGSQF